MSETNDFKGVLVDSHCHLDCLEGVKDSQSLKPYIQAAHDMGVQGMLSIGITLEAWDAMMAMIEPFSNIWATVGVHPNEVPGENIPYEALFERAQHPRVIGIGETGLDFFRSEGDLDWQYERFETHIAVAKALDMPLVVHCRDAFDETYEVLKKNAPPKTIIHCFTGNKAQAERFLSLDGVYISISGIVTFKNAQALQEAVPVIPIDRLLVETDAPYLAPMPHRGQSNEPAYTYYTAKKVAALKAMLLSDLALHTTANFEQLFGVRVMPLDA